MKYVEDYGDEDPAKYFVMNHLQGSTEASREIKTGLSEASNSTNDRPPRATYATNERATRPAYPTNNSVSSQGPCNQFEVLNDKANELQSSEDVNSNQSKILNVSNAKGSPFLE